MNCKHRNPPQKRGVGCYLNFLLAEVNEMPSSKITSHVNIKTRKYVFSLELFSACKLFYMINFIHSMQEIINITISPPYTLGLSLIFNTSF